MTLTSAGALVEDVPPMVAANTAVAALAVALIFACLAATVMATLVFDLVAGAFAELAFLFAAAPPEADTTLAGAEVVFFF